MIQLKNVSKFYYNKGMITSGITKVDLSFDIGEFVVITGESGSGKTTLLNVISGLDSYEEGEMYIEGRETSHYLSSDFEEYRKKYIGNIFQDFNLVNSYTVYQNIELILLVNGYKKETVSRRVTDLIGQVGLEEYADTKVSKLSGGQKQRVSIARALAKDTDIIVADEPTGNLDSVSAQGIVKLLSEIAHDKLVIVVTHNYQQFAAYATRKIKMHDGAVVEDERVIDKRTADAGSKGPSGGSDAGTGSAGSITAGSVIRLGVRNTFNIASKFILLLIVFLFVVFALTFQYTTYLNQSAEGDRLGYNYYFENYSSNRIVLKKADNAVFSEDDLKVVGNVDNVGSVEANDILLDTDIILDSDDFSYEAYTRALSDFDKDDLVEGTVPKAGNEVVLAIDKDYAQDDCTPEDVMDKTFSVYIGEDTEIKVKVVGFAYKESGDAGSLFVGDMYATDDLINTLLEETYGSFSDVRVTINGKVQEYETGSAFYRVIPNSNVSSGEALVSSELNNFYDNGGVKGHTITVTAENIYYTESVKLNVDDTYGRSTFKSKTGLSDYDENDGVICVSQKDYDKLFAKGNYQATVYVDDTEDMDNTLEALKTMGYVPLALRDTLENTDNDISSIITVPLLIVELAALLFIAYFVIRLILKSRSVYFSILRMLGMAKKRIRRILDVEMLLTANIAYAVFICFILVVKYGLLHISYVANLIMYMGVVHYVIIYVIAMLIAYLISGQFSRSLFKKTAMGTYREESK